jgi:FkbM family methyltransferase
VNLSETSKRVRDTICAQQLALARGVLHLGAHIGHEAPKYAHAKKPVVWVEALPDIYEQLVARLRDFPGQRAVRALLGDVDGTEQTFLVSNNDSGVSSSLFQFGPYGSGTESLWPELDLHMVAELTLPMMTLDTLFRDSALDPADYDYWVVDLQGAELLALRGARDAVRHCRALYVEVSSVPVYDQAPLWPDLRGYVEAAGFVSMWEPELDHDDVLFVRGGPQRARDRFHAQRYLGHYE